MKTWLVPMAAALFGLAEVAGADGIQKWRTPGGSLYFGDHPPAGSTLVDTYADTPPAVPVSASEPPAAAAPSTETELSKAAAEGRDIIRRREEARAEQRRADQERQAREAEAAAAAAAAPLYDTGYPWYIATTNVAPCRVGESCRDPRRNHGRPAGPPPGTGSWAGPGSPPYRSAPVPRASGGSFAASGGRRAVR
jgi:hypothetical protein